MIPRLLSGINSPWVSQKLFPRKARELIERVHFEFRRRLPGRVFVGLFLLILIPRVCHAKKTYLTITSEPSGASVEIDGIIVGKTPFSVEIPATYLKGSHYVLSKFLRHQMHLRLTLDGYLAKEVDLADGPMQLVALNGVNHGDYWILKNDVFNFALEKEAKTFTGNIQATFSNAAPVVMRPGLATEEIVRLASPAVLFLKGSDSAGSGFLVSDTGIAVTNAHVARGQVELTATTGNGQTFSARVVYIDAALDIALLKLEGNGFPQLRLAETATIQPGSTVIAMGTPSRGFQNSVTKGIVGGIGPMRNEAGTWIQTDAAINPGNSGGPLLSEAGEVVGITTQKEFLSGDGRPLQGIGFALSSNDLLSVLRRFYPEIGYVSNPRHESRGKGKVSITSNGDGAEIYIDGKFVGDTPTTFTLASGPHNIEVKRQDGAGWQRQLEVLEDSEVKLNAVLQVGSNQTMSHAPAQNDKPSLPLPSRLPDTVNGDRASTLDNTNAPQDLAKSQQPPSPTEISKTIGTGFPENFASISIASDPTGAEVYVDNSFAGKAPIILNLKIGQHYVRMIAKGYKIWSQQITVVVGSGLKLGAKLEKSE